MKTVKYIFHDKMITFEVTAQEFALIGNALLDEFDRQSKAEGVDIPGPQLRQVAELMEQRLKYYMDITLNINTEDFRDIVKCLLSVAGRTRGDTSKWHDLVQKLHTQAQEQGAVEVREERV